jgi:hypothetical protein
MALRPSLCFSIDLASHAKAEFFDGRLQIFALPRLGRLNTGGNDFRSHSKLNLRIDHLPNCVAGATRTWIKAMDNVKNAHREKAVSDRELRLLLLKAQRI